MYTVEVQCDIHVQCGRHIYSGAYAHNWKCMNTSFGYSVDCRET